MRRKPSRIFLCQLFRAETRSELGGRWKLDCGGAICFYFCMHRTTILLPEELYRAAGREARSLGVSLGELIRRRLATVPSEPPKQEAFFARRPWSGEAPDDLSANHDRYLYGP